LIFFTLQIPKIQSKSTIINDEIKVLKINNNKHKDKINNYESRKKNKNKKKRIGGCK